MYKWIRPIVNPVLKLLHTIVMSKWIYPLVMPFIWLYMKIAEPRIIRLMQFGIYVGMALAGFGVISHPPASFESVLGGTLTYTFGGFLFVGSIFGAIAVLPGIWWLERAGLLSLITGLFIYIVAIDALGSSPMGIILSLMFGLTFGQRWMEIRKYQLAPRTE